MSSEYRISLDWIKGAEIAPFQKGAIDDIKGANDSTKGCNPRQERVQPVAPANNHHRTINEPSAIVGADAPKAKTVRAMVLPVDFMPNETAEQMARDFGLDLAREQAAFEDHHSAKGSTFKDWQAAFRTWLRNSQKYAQRSPVGRGFSIDPHAPVETFAQRAARQRMEEVAPMAARKAPGQPNAFEQAQAFMNGGEVIDVTPRQQLIGGAYAG